MAETRCPACGHSPIPPGVEACPVCGEPFDFLPAHRRARNRFLDDDEPDLVTSTVHGALTNALAAHPGPAATLLLAGAVAWALRAVGVFGEGADPSRVFAIVGLDVALALLLLMNLGPVKLLVSLGMVAQLGLIALLAAGRAGWTEVAFALHALAVLGLALGEAGRIRRWTMTAAGLLGVAAALFLVGRPIPIDATRRVLEDSTLGYRLALPEGHRPLPAAEVETRLRVPPETMTRASVTFGAPEADELGLLTFSRGDGGGLEQVCANAWAATLVSARGGQKPDPLAKAVPPALGTGLVYALPPPSGPGLFACARIPDGRLITLSVAGRTDAPDRGEALFDRVGAGLSLE